MVYRDDCTVHVRPKHNMAVVNYDTGQGEKWEVDESYYYFFDDYQEVLYKMFIYASAKQKSDRNL